MSATLNSAKILTLPVLTAKDAARLRKRMERAVERLIAAMDALDVDTDLEDGGDDELNGDDEPSLGSIGSSGPYGQSLWAGGTTDDQEAVNEHGGDILNEPHDQEPDEEPSLGSLDDRVDQTDWGSGDGNDFELGHHEDDGEIARDWSQSATDATRAKVREAKARLREITKPPPARDPDECVLITPGIMQLIMQGRL